MRTPVLIILLLSLSLPPWAADALEFRGDRLTSSFLTGQERTLLEGNARIVSGDLVIEAESIELWGKGYRFAACRGSVIVRDRKKNLEIRADAMDYDRTLKLSTFQGLCQMDDPDQGVTVRCGRFTYDEENEKAVFQAGVRLFKGDLVCRAEMALYQRTAATLELTGLPQVFKKSDQYQASTIRVNLNTEDVSLEGRVTGTITPDREAP